MTPLQAAKKCAEELEKMGYADVRVWDEEKVKNQGFSVAAKAQIACEGVDFCDIQLNSQGPFKKGMQPYSGVFCEPYSCWLMSFYIDK
jgi:hypothetical protein